MIIKSKNIDNISSYNIDIFKESVFFDIETTGLNPEFSKIVMIGVLYFENGNYILTQLFSEKDGEKEIIGKFLKTMKNYKYLVSYNGNSFDLRFIKKRAELNSLNFNANNKCLVDLLKVFRVNRHYFNTENLKLKSVEKFSNIDRKDSISGEDFIKIYKSYLLNPKKEYLELMFQHNFEDVANLPKLFKNYGLFEDRLNIYYKEYFIDIFVNNKSFSKQNSRINLTANTYSIISLDTIMNDFNYKLDWNKKSGKMHFEILANKGKLRDGRLIYYLDLKEIFDAKLTFNNNYNIPDNFLVLSVDNVLKKNNILKFIYLLFDYKKIP